MLKARNKWATRLLMTALLALPVFPLPASAASTISISAYGADGSDANDDAAAINNAIQAAAPGDTVYFPSGTYYISTTILAKAGIKLEGQSRDTTILKYSGTTDAPMLSLTNQDNVEVAQLTFDGNNNAHVTRGINAEPSNGSYVHHIRVQGLVGTTGFGPFGILFSGSDDVRITDNDFQNIGPASIWGGAIRAGWGSDNAQILRNTIANTGRGGIFLNNGETGAVVRENVVTGSGLSDPNLGLSIELHTDVNQAVVEDNVVDHWISVVISDYNAVRRNTVQATDGTYKSYGLEISSGNSVVTDNWVGNGQKTGISSTPGRDYTYFGYNHIQNMIQWGMQMQSINSYDAPNLEQYFYKNEFLNTDKDNPNASYPEYIGHGVRFHGRAQNVTLDSNLISGNDRFGIEFTTFGEDDKFSFVNNTITNNGLESINYYPADSTNLEWSNNTVSGNGTDIQLTSRGFSNQKPVANFTGPTSLLVGQAATFTNTSTDADGTISHNLWDFGEGVPVTTTSPTYIYQKAGTYRVTLMTTDNEGRSSIKEQTIVVSVGPPDTQAPTAPTGLTSPAKTDTSVTLTWSASTDNYAVAQYQIYQGTSQVGLTNGSTTTFQVTGLQPETAYSFTIKAKDAAGNVSAASGALSVTTDEPPGGGTGSITREYWSNISGSAISSIPVSTAPTGTDTLTSLEGPSNWGEAYGDRIRGYITPDITGSYTFWVAGDDTAELWISTDAEPAHKALIASVPDWTGYRQWNKYASQQSAAVTLTGGQSYYVEVLHKEGHGDDSVSVGWTGPGIPTTTVISGGYLTPYGGGTPPADTQAPSAPTGLNSPAKTSTTVDLSWTASTDNVGVTGYDVYKNGVLAGSTTGATTFQATGLTAGTAYSFTVKAKDAAGNVSAASSALSVTTNTAGGGGGSGTGTIIREYWTGISGDSVASIPVNTTPTGTQTLTSLEGPSNWGNGYGDRIRGYITPAVTGSYTFYIASDNAGELWLSSGDNPANKVKIAYVSTWTGYRQWTASSTQQSAAVSLTAGQRYYVEVLHKEDSSADHVSVGWTGPGISSVTVIDGSYLSPFDGSSGSTDTQAPTAPTGLTSPAKTATTVDLSWTASTDNVGVTGYDVYKDGVLAGSTAGATTFQVTGLTASTAYSFTVKAKDAAGNVSAASGALSVTTNAASGGGGSGTGTIIREYWTGISGDSVASIPVNTTPTGTQTLTSLEGPSNWGNGYGDRIRGYITPSVTGSYTFYLASDNAGELWLSTDNNPANKVKIAYVSTWTGYRQWTVSANQHSAAINLTAGQSYYVEVLHKEDTSADHVSVGWTGPNISTITVIDGSYLSPY